MKRNLSPPIVLTVPGTIYELSNHGYISATKSGSERIEVVAKSRDCIAIPIIRAYTLMVAVTRPILKVGVEEIAALTKKGSSNADDFSVVGLWIMDKRAELNARDFVQRRRVDAQGILNIGNSTERIRILP